MKDAHFGLLFSNIAGIYREIQRLRAEHSAQLDIKSVQVFWIFILKDHPEGMIASQLAAESEMNRSLVSREIKELVDRDIVCYEDADQNKYAKKIFLTENGKVLAEQIDAIAMNVQEQVDQGISEKDLAVFYKVLSKLNQNFNQLRENEEK